MKYLVDTNILIYLMNSKSERLQKQFTRRNIEDFTVSAVTIAELIYGARKSRHVEKNLNAVIKLLSPFKVIDFTGKDAFEYGDIRVDLEGRGRIIGANDLLIAAQARRRGLVVITANTKEFERVKGLTIVNWMSE